jgi:hypothetical protein
LSDHERRYLPQVSYEDFLDAFAIGLAESEYRERELEREQRERDAEWCATYERTPEELAEIRAQIRRVPGDEAARSVIDLQLPKGTTLTFVFRPQTKAPRPRTKQVRSSPRRRSRTTTAARARSPGGGEDSEPPLARPCELCGEPLPADSAPQRHYHDRCGDAKRQRELYARRRGLPDCEELLERARLARIAISDGADPHVALMAVVWPNVAREVISGRLQARDERLAPYRKRAAA